MKADQAEISGHYLMALMSNIHLYAGGLAQISPAAKLDDGKIDLWLFEGDTLGDTIQRAWDLYAGRHIDSERVHCIPFSHLVLESDRPLYVQVDAEPMPFSGRSVEIKVIPKGLKLLVPAQTPRELFQAANSMQ